MLPTVRLRRLAAGGSLAIDGAYALYQALAENDLTRYENFRPFIDQIQAEVLADNLPMLVMPSLGSK